MTGLNGLQVCELKTSKKLLYSISAQVGDSITGWPEGKVAG